MTAEHTASSLRYLLLANDHSRLATRCLPRTPDCLLLAHPHQMLTVIAMHFDMASIRRELKDGLYHPIAVAVASWIVQATRLDETRRNSTGLDEP